MVGRSRPGFVVVAAVLAWSSLLIGPSATAVTGSPVPHGLVTSATVYTFTQLSAGGSHTCGVKTDGTVACWGYNNLGQATPPSGSFTSVSAGGSHTCGMRTSGKVACWGRNNYGQARRPLHVVFSQVDAGGEYTCGVRTDQFIACWGLQARN
jgi:alpha-tubulin suppressor-like RCC1 family protein